LQNTREFSCYIYPQQNSFSFPLSWRAQAYKMEDGRRRRYKEEEGMVPINPSRPPSSPKGCFFVSNHQRCLSFEQPSRNRAKLPC